MLKLQAIENYLNSGSAYFFLTLNNGDCAKEAGSHPIMEKCPSYWAKTITEFSLLKLREISGVLPSIRVNCLRDSSYMVQSTLRSSPGLTLRIVPTLTQFVSNLFLFSTSRNNCCLHFLWRSFQILQPGRNFPKSPWREGNPGDPNQQLQGLQPCGFINQLFHQG